MVKLEPWQATCLAEILPERRRVRAMNRPKALRLFLTYSPRGLMDQLYGPAKATCRAHILDELLGCHVPKSAASWSVFRAAMHMACDCAEAGCGCNAAADRHVREFVPVFLAENEAQYTEPQTAEHNPQSFAQYLLAPTDAAGSGVSE